MKKYLFLSFAAALFLWACSKEDVGPVLKVGNVPTITAPAAGNTFILTDSTAGNIFAAFAWTAADFGFDAGVSYSVELDKAGNNFAEPVTLGTVNALALGGITQEKINTILLSKGLPGEAVSDVEFRIAAKVNPDVPVVYSLPVAAKVRPYTVVIVYPQLQVPGSYQGWNPADNTTVIFSAKSDDKYEGYIYFADAGSKYKFTKGTTWDTNWGDTDANGTLDPGGTDIALVDAGVYKLNADLVGLTHSSTKTVWGLVGDAAGSWDVDKDMTFDPATSKWTITTDLEGGKNIKFRANDGWDINLGDKDANKTLEYGGDDIKVAESGNYTIELILNRAVYTYNVTKN